MPAAPDRRVLLGCGTVFGLLVIGAWGFWPILSEDWPRAEPWRAALSLTGEACGAAGLLLFGWRHGVRGVPVGAGAAGGRAAFWAGAAALVGGLLGDLAVTGSAVLEERRGFARSVAADADAVVTRTGGIADVTYHRFRVRFRDAAGTPHAGLLDTVYRLRATDGHPAGFEPRLPAVPGAPGAERLLRARGGDAVGTRFGVRVRYDPRRPARVWVDGEGWSRDHAGQHVFLLVHIFQAIAVLGAVNTLWQASGALRDDGRAAAKWELPFQPAVVAAVLPAVPLAIEAVVLALFGVLWRVRGF